MTTHPAFRNGARSVARLCDGLHDPETKDVLTDETDIGSGGYTHPFFSAPMSADGVILRGVKMVATGSAFSNYNFVSYHGSTPTKKEEYAISFFAPMNAQGVKSRGRTSSSSATSSSRARPT